MRSRPHSFPLAAFIVVTAIILAYLFSPVFLLLLILAFLLVV